MGDPPLQRPAVFVNGTKDPVAVGGQVIGRAKFHLGLAARTRRSASLPNRGPTYGRAKFHLGLGSQDAAKPRQSIA